MSYLYDDVRREDARRVLVHVTVEVLVAHPEADRHLVLHVQHTRVRAVPRVNLEPKSSPVKCTLDVIEEDQSTVAVLSVNACKLCRLVPFHNMVIFKILLTFSSP